MMPSARRGHRGRSGAERLICGRFVFDKESRRRWRVAIACGDAAFFPFSLSFFPPHSISLVTSGQAQILNESRAGIYEGD